MVELSSVGAGGRADDEVLDLATLGEVGTFMSKVFNQRRIDREEQDPDPAPTSPAAADPVGELDEVDLLLAKASKAIEILATRCEIAEHDLDEAADRLAEQAQTANRWKVLALEMRSTAAADQDTIAVLRARAEAAEARVVSLEAAADQARERVAAADAKSSRLHHQVITAFGRKSPVHSVLQAVTFQEAAE